MIKKFQLIPVIVLLLCSCNELPELQTSQNNSLVVYPIPAQHVVSVQVRNMESQVYTVQVFNTQGKVILRESITGGMEETFSINLSHEKNGYFHVVLDKGKETVTKKFMKL